MIYTAYRIAPQGDVYAIYGRETDEAEWKYLGESECEKYALRDAKTMRGGDAAPIFSPSGYAYPEAGRAWKNSPQARYAKAHSRVIGVKVTDSTDADIIEWLAAQPSMSGYIKRLIREDIERHG